MQFWEYTSIYQRTKKFVGKNVNQVSEETYYAQLRRNDPRKKFAKLDTDFEESWLNAGKPYYKAYPCIINMIEKLDLDAIPIHGMQMPIGLNSLLIRLPKAKNRLSPVRSICMYSHYSAGQYKAINLLFDTGKTIGKLKQNRLFYLPNISVDYQEDGFDCSLGKWLEMLLKSVRGNARTVADEIGELNLHTSIKLCMSLSLIGSDPELIQPEVLNADEHKLNGQHNIEALVAKARRRGKYGFTIGKDIEVMPHYRRPHLALVWYGPGKKKKKIIPRKGSIVHRSKVEKIPTGYGAEE